MYYRITRNSLQDIPILIYQQLAWSLRTCKMPPTGCYVLMTLSMLQWNMLSSAVPSQELEQKPKWARHTWLCQVTANRHPLASEAWTAANNCSGCTCYSPLLTKYDEQMMKMQTKLEQKKKNNILVLGNSDVSIACVAHTDFKLVAKSWQRPTSLCTVCTECTTTTSAMMLHQGAQNTLTVLLPATYVNSPSLPNIHYL